MRILTAEAMREVDRAAIEQLGLSSLVLMENAAIGVADALGESYPEASSAAIFCGPGNNGGDGLAVARHLATRGHRVIPIIATEGRDLQGDAAAQRETCRRIGLELVTLGDDVGIEQVPDLCRSVDLLVDALFGTGLGRPLSGLFAGLIEILNQAPLPRVAVDLPSGLFGGSREIPGPHLRADLTVTFAAPKIAHVFDPAASAAGRVVVADLGFPAGLVERAGGDLRLLSAAELSPLLPARPDTGHKGDFGHVLLVAGSVGKSGAAVLAARSAVRCGAGLVSVGAPGPIVDAVEAGSLESMTLPLPVNGAGGIDPVAVDLVLEALVGKHVLALGPGLGSEAGTRETVCRLALAADVPLVLDADGVNAFAGQAERLADRRTETILTPHPGELARLLECSTSEVESDRPGAARRAAEITGAVVVLKGHQTLVADPLGGIAVNPTGNPGMATGGTGDVLTGAVAALVAQGLAAPDAACLGVFVHGLAGDIAAESSGMIALNAGDLLEWIPTAFERLRRE